MPVREDSEIKRSMGRGMGTNSIGLSRGMGGTGVGRIANRAYGRGSFFSPSIHLSLIGCKAKLP